MKTKLHIVLLLALAALIASCTGSKLTAEERAQRAAVTAQAVMDAINNRSFTIDIDRMSPRSMPARSLNYGYSLRLSGDSIYSDLPYVGRAYRVPYDGGHALSFSGLLSGYSVTRSKKGFTRVEMTYEDSEDHYYYVLDIFDNGFSTLECVSRERDRINFSGQVDFTR